MNTATKYLGVDVKSPVIVGSCGLSEDMDRLVQMEAAGAGAVVLKSIFEEQIIHDIKSSTNTMMSTEQYGATYEYIAAHMAADSMNRHFAFIREAKRRLTIPVIGSINCYTFENWLTYAKKFEEAGCDGLELNMAILPYDTSMSGDDIERLFSNVVKTLRKSMSIPISLKVSQNFTDMAKFMQQLSWSGIQGITIFNKPLNIDINTESLSLTTAPSLSSPEEVYNTLRWTAILSKQLRCDLNASTGVHSADDVVKLLLAGAQCVQVVSVLYKEGIDYLRTMNDGLRTWMQQHNYDDISQFRGKLAVKTNEDASMFLRTQFMKHVGQIV